MSDGAKELMMNRTGAILAVLTSVMLMLAGCGGYTIQGRVVGETFSSVQFVDPSDNRLESRGVSGATIELLRNPDSLGREVVATVTSDGSGNFIIPVSTFGAGWLDESWLVRVRAVNYTGAESFIILPGKPGDKRLLIAITRGESIFRPDDDLMKQYDSFR